GRRLRVAGRRPGTARGSSSPPAPARPAAPRCRAAWVLSTPGSGRRSRTASAPGSAPPPSWLSARPSRRLPLVVAQAERLVVGGRVAFGPVAPRRPPPTGCPVLERLAHRVGGLAVLGTGDGLLAGPAPGVLTDQHPAAADAYRVQARGHLDPVPDRGRV